MQIYVKLGKPGQRAAEARSTGLRAGGLENAYHSVMADQADKTLATEAEPGLEGRFDPTTTGLIIVDHGSRVDESNNMLLSVVGMYRRFTGWPIVEPAHMELAEPTIAQAFDRCVEQGAKRVVTFPFFLLPGRHWSQDIPQLVEQAAAKHEHVDYLVTAPLATHPLINRIIADRIDHCLSCAAGEAEPCAVCGSAEVTCRFRSG